MRNDEHMKQDRIGSDIAQADSLVIELREFLLSVLIRWKVFMLGALIFAGITFAYGLTRANEAYDSNDQDDYITQRISALEDVMTDAELNDAEELLKRMRDERKFEEQVYKSYVMRISPYYSTKVSMVCSIKSADDSERELLRNLYTNYIYSDEFIDRFSEAIGIEPTEALMIDNLLEVRSLGDGMYVISFFVPEDFGAEKLAEEIKDILKNAPTENKNNSAQLIFEECTYNKYNNSDEIFKVQSDIQTEAKKNEDLIRRKLRQQSTNARDYIAYRAKQEDIEVSEYYKYADVFSNDIPMPQMSAPAPAPTIAYLLFGFVGGLFFEVLVYLIVMIFVRKANRIWGEEAFPGGRLIGSIYTEPGVYSNGLIYSKSLLNILKKKLIGSRNSDGNLISKLSYEVSDLKDKNIYFVTLESEKATRLRVNETMLAFIPDLRKRNDEADISLISISPEDLKNGKIYDVAGTMNGNAIFVATAGVDRLKSMQSVETVLKKRMSIIGTILAE